MTNLAKIKRLYLWKPSICKTFWTTLVAVKSYLFHKVDGSKFYRSSGRFSHHIILFLKQFPDTDEKNINYKNNQKTHTRWLFNIFWRFWRQCSKNKFRSVSIVYI